MIETDEVTEIDSVNMIETEYKLTTDQRSMTTYKKPVFNGRFGNSGVLRQPCTIPKGTIIKLVENTTNPYHPEYCIGIIIQYARTGIGSGFGTGIGSGSGSGFGIGSGFGSGSVSGSGIGTRSEIGNGSETENMDEPIDIYQDALFFVNKNLIEKI